jgi:hypothetical protein
VYINAERKLIYIANPKTASVATRDALRNQAGFQKYHKRTDSFPLDINVDGGSHHGRLDSPPPPGWTVATSIRNPWKTMLSWYTAHEQFSEPFNWSWIDEWIRMHERQYFPDTSKLFWFGTEFADVIMRVENLVPDLCAFLGQEITVPRENVSTKKLTVSEAYDEVTREYVAWRFAAEIQEYGYAYPG